MKRSLSHSIHPRILANGASDGERKRQAAKVAGAPPQDKKPFIDRDKGNGRQGGKGTGKSSILLSSHLSNLQSQLPD